MNAWRLALGTLTIFPVRPPETVDRRTAGRAMLLAPLVALFLALPCVVVLEGTRFIGEFGTLQVGAADLLGGALALALAAWLTRGLHLDGLADAADGLGVKEQGEAGIERRLEVMRAPDVGAFGVITLVFVILIQVTALYLCTTSGHGGVGLVVSMLAGRVALPWMCRTSVTAARPDGLGATVAGTVPIAAAALVSVLAMAIAAGLGAADDDATRRLIVMLPVSLIIGVAAAILLQRRCTRAFGGMTGDVLGAGVEIATAVTLLVIALFA